MGVLTFVVGCGCSLEVSRIFFIPSLPKRLNFPSSANATFCRSSEVPCRCSKAYFFWLFFSDVLGFCAPMRSNSPSSWMRLVTVSLKTSRRHSLLIYLSAFYKAFRCKKKYYRLTTKSPSKTKNDKHEENLHVYTLRQIYVRFAVSNQLWVTKLWFSFRFLKKYPKYYYKRQSRS